MEKIYTGVNPLKLHAELIDNHIGIMLSTSIDDTLTVSFADDVNLNLVQQIVEAHDPTLLPQPLSDFEKLRLEQAQANTELVQLIMMMGGA